MESPTNQDANTSTINVKNSARVFSKRIKASNMQGSAADGDQNKLIPEKRRVVRKSVRNTTPVKDKIENLKNDKPGLTAKEGPKKSIRVRKSVRKLAGEPDMEMRKKFQQMAAPNNEEMTTSNTLQLSTGSGAKRASVRIIKTSLSTRRRAYLSGQNHDSVKPSEEEDRTVVRKVSRRIKVKSIRRPSQQGVENQSNEKPTALPAHGQSRRIRASQVRRVDKSEEASANEENKLFPATPVEDGGNSLVPKTRKLRMSRIAKFGNPGAPVEATGGASTMSGKTVSIRRVKRSVRLAPAKQVEGASNENGDKSKQTSEPGTEEKPKFRRSVKVRVSSRSKPKQMDSASLLPLPGSEKLQSNDKQVGDEMPIGRPKKLRISKYIKVQDKQGSVRRVVRASARHTVPLAERIKALNTAVEDQSGEQPSQYREKYLGAYLKEGGKHEEENDSETIRPVRKISKRIIRKSCRNAPSIRTRSKQLQQAKMEPNAELEKIRQSRLDEALDSVTRKPLSLPKTYHVIPDSENDSDALDEEDVESKIKLQVEENSQDETQRNDLRKDEEFKTDPNINRTNEDPSYDSQPSQTNYNAVSNKPTIQQTEKREIKKQADIKSTSESFNTEMEENECHPYLNTESSDKQLSMIKGGQSLIFKNEQDMANLSNSKVPGNLEENESKPAVMTEECGMCDDQIMASNTEQEIENEKQASHKELLIENRLTQSDSPPNCNVNSRIQEQQLLQHETSTFEDTASVSQEVLEIQTTNEAEYDFETVISEDQVNVENDNKHYSHNADIDRPSIPYDTPGDLSHYEESSKTNVEANYEMHTTKQIKPNDDVQQSLEENVQESTDGAGEQSMTQEYQKGDTKLPTVESSSYLECKTETEKNVDYKEPTERTSTSLLDDIEPYEESEMIKTEMPIIGQNTYNVSDEKLSVITYPGEAKEVKLVEDTNNQNSNECVIAINEEAQLLNENEIHIKDYTGETENKDQQVEKGFAAIDKNDVVRQEETTKHFEKIEKHVGEIREEQKINVGEEQEMQALPVSDKHNENFQNQPRTADGEETNTHIETIYKDKNEGYGVVQETDTTYNEKTEDPHDLRSQQSPQYKSLHTTSETETEESNVKTEQTKQTTNISQSSSFFQDELLNENEIHIKDYTGETENEDQQVEKGFAAIDKNDVVRQEKTTKHFEKIEKHVGEIREEQKINVGEEQEMQALPVSDKHNENFQNQPRTADGEETNTHIETIYKDKNEGYGVVQETDTTYNEKTEDSHDLRSQQSPQYKSLHTTSETETEESNVKTEQTKQTTNISQSSSFFQDELLNENEIHIKDYTGETENEDQQVEKGFAAIDKNDVVRQEETTKHFEKIEKHVGEIREEQKINVGEEQEMQALPVSDKHNENFQNQPRTADGEETNTHIETIYKDKNEGYGVVQETDTTYNEKTEDPHDLSSQQSPQYKSLHTTSETETEESNVKTEQTKQTTNISQSSSFFQDEFKSSQTDENKSASNLCSSNQEANLNMGTEEEDNEGLVLTEKWRKKCRAKYIHTYRMHAREAQQQQDYKREAEMLEKIHQLQAQPELIPQEFEDDEANSLQQTSKRDDAYSDASEELSDRDEGPEKNKVEIIKAETSSPQEKTYYEEEEEEEEEEDEEEEEEEEEEYDEEEYEEEEYEEEEYEEEEYEEGEYEDEEYEEDNEEEVVVYVDEDGNEIEVDEDAEFDEDGNQIIYVTDSEEEEIGSDEEIVYEDEDGNLVDADGNPIDEDEVEVVEEEYSDDGEEEVIYMDEDGNYVDADGNIVEYEPDSDDEVIEE